MQQSAEIFIGTDVSKARNAIAVTGGGRNGESALSRRSGRIGRQHASLRVNCQTLTQLRKVSPLLTDERKLSHWPGDRSAPKSSRLLAAQVYVF